MNVNPPRSAVHVHVQREPAGRHQVHGALESRGIEGARVHFLVQLLARFIEPAVALGVGPADAQQRPHADDGVAPDTTAAASVRQASVAALCSNLALRSIACDASMGRRPAGQTPHGERVIEAIAPDGFMRAAKFHQALQPAVEVGDVGGHQFCW